jgi:predicted dehydrogenase
MTHEPLRIAVLGTGDFGAVHARTLAGLEGVRLTALGDREVGRARLLAESLGVARAVASLEDLIAESLADAVVIATPSGTHAALAVQALAAGLHVLVEKPAGTTVAEVRQIDAARQRAGRVAMAGHVCLFHSLVWPLVERVRAEGFRSCHFVRHRPAALATALPGVHPLSMTTVHDLAVMSRIVADDEPVVCEAWDAVGPAGSVDHSWALLRWADGRTATFHSHWMLPPAAGADGHDWMEVFGGDYYTRIDTNPQPWSWATEAATSPVTLEMSTVQGRPTGMLAEELRSFLAACRGAGVPGGCRIADAIRIQQWTERLLAAAKRSRQPSAGGGPMAGPVPRPTPAVRSGAS